MLFCIKRHFVNTCHFAATSFIPSPTLNPFRHWGSDNPTSPPLHHQIISSWALFSISCCGPWRGGDCERPPVAPACVSGGHKRDSLRSGRSLHPHPLTYTPPSLTVTGWSIRPSPARLRSDPWALKTSLSHSACNNGLIGEKVTKTRINERRALGCLLLILHGLSINALLLLL